MKVFTIWKACPDDDEMPWLVAAVDEHTIETCDGFPEAYAKERKDDRRELVIDIPESAVRNLFRTPIVKGQVKP